MNSGFAATIGGYAIPPRPALPGQPDAIVIARVLCILGIIYVHAWTGRDGFYINSHSDTWQGMMRWFIVEAIGRSSVPLLGMVSGWLVASSALRRPYWDFVKGKVRTILAPMLLWNLFAIILVGGAVWMGWIDGPRPNGWRWAVKELTSITALNKINYPTPFLRDLFVCMLLAPLAIRLRDRALVCLTLLVGVWAIANWHFPLLIRPQIGLFFLIGVGARRWGAAERVVSMPLALAALPFVLLVPIKFWLSVWGRDLVAEHLEMVLAIEVAMRVAAAMFMWRLCSALSRRPIAKLIKRFEPYVFLLFCSHMIMIWLGAQQLGRLTGPLDSPAYPILFLAHPLLVMLGTLLLGQFLLLLSPDLASLLSGGRLARQPVEILRARSAEA